jgi:hypothetical protein
MIETCKTTIQENGVYIIKNGVHNSAGDVAGVPSEW